MMVFPKRLFTFTPKEISLALTRVSCSKGADDFREKSVSVSVRFGKCLKKETFISVKFNSLLRERLARFFTSCFILSWKMKGVRIRISKTAMRIAPDILRAFFMIVE
jgi:hypothetical protein